MSNSVRSHRWQPTRLPCPWDSPGKNTGVGCHFLLQCTKVKSEKWKWSRSVVPDSQRPHGLQPTRLHHPWDFPGKSTEMGCHCLLQQIQCNPYQITHGIFHRTRTKNFTVHTETKKTPNSQRSLEKEEWSWRNQPSDYNTKLQSSKQYGTGTKTEI